MSLKDKSYAKRNMGDKKGQDMKESWVQCCYGYTCMCTHVQESEVNAECLSQPLYVTF